MPKKAKSLDEFAASSRKRGTPPWITQFPEWGEMKVAYKNGVPPSVIYRWLHDEKGYSDEALHGTNRFRVALCSNLDR